MLMMMFKKNSGDGGNVCDSDDDDNPQNIQRTMLREYRGRDNADSHMQNTDKPILSFV